LQHLVGLIAEEIKNEREHDVAHGEHKSVEKRGVHAQPSMQLPPASTTLQ
jgi:hypothetical protein